MMQIVIQVAVFGVIIGTVVGGFRDGAFAAAYSALRTFFCLIIAMTFFEPVSYLIYSNVERFSVYPGPDYIRAIVFPTLFALVFGLARMLKVRYTAPKVQALPMVDRIAGPVLGLLNGIIIAGIICIMWSLMPFARYMPSDSGTVDERRLVWDAGATTLRFYSFMCRRMPGAKPFLLEPEKIVNDTNGNGRVDAGTDDSWEDTLPNGKWDEGWLARYRNGDEFTSDVIDRITAK